MKNKKRNFKFNKPLCFDKIDLTLPSIFFAVYLIFSGIILIYSGTIYTYYWILLPRGALSLWVFLLLFVIMFSFLGATTGFFINKKVGCYRKYKNIIVTALCVTAFLTVLWYDSIFSAHGFFAGFILSLFSLLCMLTSLLISLNRYKILSIGLGALTIWYLYILWFSFSIMIIN